MVTALVVRALLRYDPETGIFTWRVRRGHIPQGATAGTKDKRGMVLIRIFRRHFKAHRLAWLYMMGEWPQCELDHRDRDPGNNRWTNLREATRIENMANLVVRERRHRLPPGVYWSLNKFQAQIRHDGVKRYLGTFDTPELAHEAYLAEKRALVGEFCPIISASFPSEEHQV
jgi:hypothetical protein